MAPFVPEEVDVFTIPHSRMKELVNDYADMIKKTNFKNDTDLKLLLESLLRTFMEFKYHEQIENQLIMKKLKNRLKQLSIQNAAVCNCHNDDDLGRMMAFIKGGYKKKTVQDRVNFGLKLVKALEDFTETFIPHMQEEEEVFQPMLLQYFGYEELCDLKKKVIQQHICKEHQLFQEQEVLPRDDKGTKKDDGKKIDVDDKETDVVADAADQTSLGDLPPELKLRVLSYLKPPDVCRMSGVSREWHELCKDPQLWPELYPVMWAKGNWVTHMEHTEESEDEDLCDEFTGMEESDSFAVLDIDADVDETEPDIVKEVRRETEILSGLVKYVLPRAGTGTKKLVLKNSRALTNSVLNKMIQLCPNLEFLDLTQTRTSDAGLKRIGKNGCGSRLKEVIFSGCVNITDATLLRLAVAQHQSLHSSPIAFDEDEDHHDLVSRQSQQPVPSATSPQRRIVEKVEPARLTASYCTEVGGGVCECQKQQEVKVQGSSGQSAADHAMAGCVVEEEKEGSVVKADKDAYNLKASGGPKIEVECDKEETNPVTMECSDDSPYDLDCLCEIYYRECNILIDGGCEIRTHHCGRNRRIPSDNQPGEDAHTASSVEVKVKNGGKNSAKGGKAGPFQNAFKKTSDIERDKDVCCHKSCAEGGESEVLTVSAIEECVPVINDSTPPPQAGGSGERTQLASYGLKHLNFSGCFQITDVGLRSLGRLGCYPSLGYLDLSGCFRVSGEGLHSLVDACPNLAPDQLYYCDNIEDGPYADLASGCQNLECGNRVCCRSGQ